MSRRCYLDISRTPPGVRELKLQVIEDLLLAYQSHPSRGA